MTTAKWILCMIAASATSSYVTFHLNQNELDVAHIENSNHLKAANINATEQSRELAKTKKTASEIHDNNKINLNQIAHIPADIDVDNVNQAQPARIEDLQSAYEKKQNEIASFREFAARTGGGVLSAISKNYDSEPIDPEWARSKEDELLTLLDTNEILQNTAPLELSCKSQNCRLILPAHDENQGQSLYSAFKDRVLQGSDENKKQVISYFNNSERGEIQIYLSKSTVRALFNGKTD